MNQVTRYTRKEWELELRARLYDGKYTQEEYEAQLLHSQESQKKYEMSVELSGS